MYKRSLAIREKTLGPNHPEVAGSLNNLARRYGDVTWEVNPEVHRLFASPGARSSQP
jgi:hypothetical protein